MAWLNTAHGAATSSLPCPKPIYVTFPYCGMHWNRWGQNSPPSGSPMRAGLDSLRWSAKCAKHQTVDSASGCGNLICDSIGQLLRLQTAGCYQRSTNAWRRRRFCSYEWQTVCTKSRKQLSIYIVLCWTLSARVTAHAHMNWLGDTPIRMQDGSSAAKRETQSRTPEPLATASAGSDYGLGGPSRRLAHHHCASACNSDLVDAPRHG